MYISIRYTLNLPCSIYECHILHRYGQYTFAVEIYVNCLFSHYNTQLDRWGQSSIIIGSDPMYPIGPNTIPRHTTSARNPKRSAGEEEARSGTHRNDGTGPCIPESVQERIS